MKILHDILLILHFILNFEGNLVSREKSKSSILLVGGWNGSDHLKNVEIFGDGNTCQVPKLPKSISGRPNMILTNEKKLLICGGYNNEQNCLIFKENNWLKHSFLIEPRKHASTVTMPIGTFIFGGDSSPNTSEFLPNGSKSWKIGPDIPGKGLNSGCGLRISNHELLLIGGYWSKRKIIKYNTKSGIWTEISGLQEGRFGQACAVFEGKIFISGGYAFGP